MSIKGGVQGLAKKREGGKKKKRTSIRTHERTAGETSRRMTKGREKASGGRTLSLSLALSYSLSLALALSQCL
jgi:DNA repair exonuclease SbcCD ATPase subunit